MAIFWCLVAFFSGVAAANIAEFDNVRGLRFFPNDHRLLATTGDSVQIWDFARTPAEKIAEIQVGGEPCRYGYSMAIAQDGKAFALAMYTSVAVWAIGADNKISQVYRQKGLLPAPGYGVRALALSRDGRRLVYRNGPTMQLVENPLLPALQRNAVIPTPGPEVWSYTFRDHDTVLVSTAGEGTKSIDLRSGNVSAEVEEFDAGFDRTAEIMVATTASPNRVLLTNSRGESRTLWEEVPFINSATMAQDGLTAFIRHSREPHVLVYDRLTASSFSLPFADAPQNYQDIRVSADGRFVSILHFGSTVARVLDARAYLPESARLASAATWDELWKSLGSVEAGVALSAYWRLIERGAASIVEINSRLLADGEDSAPAQSIAQNIRNLDHDVYQVRERSQIFLRDRIAGEIRQGRCDSLTSLASARSSRQLGLEARKRVDALLGPWEAWVADTSLRPVCDGRERRRLRAMEIFRAIGTPQALVALAQLTGSRGHLEAEGEE